MTDDRPLIVQGYFSLLLEVQHPLHTEARDALARFTELVKAPEYLHTYLYTVVSRDSVEQELGLHRQLFLIEQGYRYVIEDFGEV